MAVYGTLKTKDGTPVYLHSGYTVNDVTYSLNDLVTALVTDPVEQVSNSRDADIEANVAYTVPEYVVGCGNIAIYLDGVRVFAGADNDFVEVGSDNEFSTAIQFNKAVAKDTQIVARVDNFICRLHHIDPYNISCTLEITSDSTTVTAGTNLSDALPKTIRIVSKTPASAPLTADYRYNLIIAATAEEYYDQYTPYSFQYVYSAETGCFECAGKFGMDTTLDTTGVYQLVFVHNSLGASSSSLPKYTVINSLGTITVTEA